MLNRRQFATVALGALAAPRLARAQAYPSRPIQVIVPFAAGGPTDTVARVVGQRMSQTLGQQLVIENVGGAGGTIGALRAARANPDGHTIIVGHMGTHAVNVGMYANLQYDPRTDFAPVANLVTNPLILMTKRQLAPNTMVEFLALLRANHQTMAGGHAGIGSASFLGALLMNSILRTNPRMVPYRGTGPAMNDLVAGVFDFMWDQTVTAVPQVQANTVKALAVSTPQRVQALANIPTAQEGGLAGYDIGIWNAMFAPRRTPPEIVQRLNAAAREAMNDPAIRNRFTEVGSVVPSGDGLSPEALGAMVRADVDKWVPIVRAANVVGE